MGPPHIAVIKRPLEEPHCGDQAGYWETASKAVLCIVDGLGHGKGAELPAKAAIDFVGRHYLEPLPEIFARCDKVLSRTRGVAMGIAVVNKKADSLTYAAIGNTRAWVLGRRTKPLGNNYGIVGAGYKTLTPHTVPFTTGQMLILATDGITENIDLSACDHSPKADVSRLAEKIVRNCKNKTDDIAVLVFKNTG